MSSVVVNSGRCQGLLKLEGAVVGVARRASGGALRVLRCFVGRSSLPEPVGLEGLGLGVLGGAERREREGAGIL